MPNLKIAFLGATGGTGSAVRAPIVLRYTTRADVAQSVIALAESREHSGEIVNVYTGGV